MTNVPASWPVTTQRPPKVRKHARAAREVGMREKKLQAVVLELARRSNWLAYHTFDSRRSEPGFPDLVMVRSGRLLFVELKSATGLMRPEQRLWRERLVKTDAEYYEWRPHDWHNGTIEGVLR